jgi:hypothetical protein
MFPTLLLYISVYKLLFCFHSLREHEHNFIIKLFLQSYTPPGCLERSLMYARHSLYNECEAQSRNGGLVHLTVASVYLEIGGFRRCLEVT